MANNDNPRGLRPVTGMGSGTYSGKGTRMAFLAANGTAAFIGGLVKPDGSGTADGVMAVTGNVASGDAVIGVIVGIEPVTDESTIYREASTDRFVFVADDPNQLFEIQEDSVGGALAATNIGNTADLVGFTAGSTAFGNSTMEIDSSTATAAGDGTEDVLIVGAVRRPDNEIGTNAKWFVRLNNHFLVDAQAGA